MKTLIAVKTIAAKHVEQLPIEHYWEGEYSFAGKTILGRLQYDGCILVQDIGGLHRIAPIAFIDWQLEHWAQLLRELKPQIGDEYRADEFDDKPGMCVTIGFTPETEDKDCSWSYQTGDNSFTGGAYGRRHNQGLATPRLARVRTATITTRFTKLQNERPPMNETKTKHTPVWYVCKTGNHQRIIAGQSAKLRGRGRGYEKAQTH